MSTQTSDHFHENYVKLLLYGILWNEAKETSGSNIFDGKMKMKGDSLDETIHEIVNDIKKIGSDMNEDIFVYSLIYICRLQDCGIYISRDNIESLVMVSILIAQKFLIDISYDNLDISNVSNMSLKTINKLEISMLCILDYNVIVSDKDYNKVLNIISKKIKHSPPINKIQ